MPFKITTQQSKKKPPPRPPPPNLNKLKSKSTHNIHKKYDSLNLIDWSPPNSPKSDSIPKFGGSVSSSFSSSTSSLASIKKSSDYEGFLPTSFSSGVWSSNNSQMRNLSPINHLISTNNNYHSSNNNNCKVSSNSASSSSLLGGPTIIRPHQKKKTRPEIPAGIPQSSASLPMPTGPPPSPPKDAADVITPYGIALYPFSATQPGDLGFEVDDVIVLIRRVNKEWLYGQVDDKEGIFPENFINVINPLPEDLR